LQSGRLPCTGRAGSTCSKNKTGLIELFPCSLQKYPKTEAFVSYFEMLFLPTAVDGIATSSANISQT